VKTEPTRTLGLASVLGLGLNTIVGSSIFRFPAELARDLGPASVLTFVAGAVLCASVGLCFAELGGMIAEEGGIYAYAQAALGRHAGFAVGWSAWVATVLTLATVAAAVPEQAAALWAPLGSPAAERATAAGVVVILGLFNVAGSKPGVWASTALIVVKVAALALFVTLGILHVRGVSLEPFAPHGYRPLGPAMLVAFFALSGFETCAVPAGEAERATHNVPLAVLVSLFGAAGLYTLVQLVVVGVLPSAGASDRPLVDAAHVFLGPSGAVAMAIAGVVSMVGLCAAMAFAAPRLLGALASDGHLPARLGGRDAGAPPRLGVVIGTAAAVLLVLTLDFRTLVDFTSVTLVGQYLAACVAVPVLRRRWPDRPRPWRVPFGPVVPVAGALLLAAVLTQTGWKEIALAVAAIAAGFVLRLFRGKAGA
jgi:amino acid transporter